MATPNNMVPLENVWLVVLKDLRLEAENVLRRARLPHDLFAQERPRVTVDEYFRFWLAVEDETADPLFPLRMVEAISPQVFYPPVFAALCSPDLTVASRRMAEHKRLCAPMIMTVDDDPSGLFVGFRWEDPAIHSPPSLAALELAFMTQIARTGTRERVVPSKVESPYPIEPREAYTEFLGAEVEQSDRHGVTFTPEDAKRPFLTANEAMWKTFEPELRRRLIHLGAGAPLLERIRAVLLETLPSGQATVDVAAQRLGMSARTLQRSLKQEGTTYKELVRRTREELARHYVTQTSISYTEIGFLLGFAEPSSFFRAFREWTGDTPESVRLATGGAG